jgi:hypothetical protein
LINDNAMPYITLSVTTENHDSVKLRILEILNKYPDTVPNIRITTQLNAENKAFYDALKRAYPQVKWSVLQINTTEINKSHKESIFEVPVTPDLTEDNIVSVIEDKLIRNKESTEMQAAVIDLLKEYVYG